MQQEGKECERKNIITKTVFCALFPNQLIIKNNNCILCYDGIMIETVNCKPELLKELEESEKGLINENRILADAVRSSFGQKVLNEILRTSHSFK